ncbi:sulfotransferase family protein [Jannaschia sp. KMU-145]|uniref:sulfotransferase family protein n=1 Tax=Jannaschia halovivens TaxID=3388667 RepID=UPI00396B176F
MRPDFIIGGAPKCGTTSLHHILHRHPDAWVAPGELYHFDADDAVAHSDFLAIEHGDLVWRDPDDPEAVAWYRSRFADAPAGALVGEDTTTYLMSAVAPDRIARTLPDAKVIVMLRDPVRRAWSQYWHLVRSGRTSLSFEAAVSAEPSILVGSTYAAPLRRYRELLGPDRLCPVLFEEFNAARQATIDRVTAFLGLAPMLLEDGAGWQNRTFYPKRAGTLLGLNRIGRRLVRYRYAAHLGRRSSLSARLGHRAYRVWYRIVSDRVLTETTPPEDMRPETRRYLNRHLSARNAGLSALLGRDLGAIWPGFTE